MTGSAERPRLRRVLEGDATILPPDAVLYFVATMLAVTGLIALLELDATTPLHEVLFLGFMYVGLAVAVLAGGVYLRLSDLPRGTWWSVVGWYLIGILSVSVLLVWSSLGDLLGGASLYTLRDQFVLFGNLGGIFGYVTGLNRAGKVYNEQLRTELEIQSELVEGARESLWMFTADWSETLYVNSAYEELFGQSVDRLYDEPTAFMEAIHPEDHANVLETMDRLTNGEPADLEYRVNAAEDFGRWVWMKGQPVYRDGEQFAVAGFSRDVTDRKEYERRIEAIFNQTYQFTGLLDPDGTLLEANDTALQFGGIEREDVIGGKLWDAHWFRRTEETRERVRSAVSRAATGEFVREELEIQGADGTAFIDFSIRPMVDDDGEVTLLIPEGRNITEQKEHERRLVALHETTRGLFQADSKVEAVEIASLAARDVADLTINSTWFYDDEQDGLVPVTSTPEAEALLESIPVLHPDESLAWEVFESGDARVYDDVSTVEGRYNDETSLAGELILPLGEFGVFSAGSTTDGFDDRQVLLAKVLAGNLEVALARIDQERRMAESRQALARQNRRLDQFASIVSHDLRNPLMIARGYLDLFEEDDETDAPGLERVNDALDRMSRLVDDLLLLSRQGDVVDDAGPIPLADVVATAWENVDTADASLQVAIHDDVVVVADEERLLQALENLFRNAVEHAGADAAVTVASTDDGFFVDDDGPGIPPGERDEVLRPGYSTNNAGTGYGLTIVRDIAAGHDWDLAVTDSESGGARFEFTGLEFA